MMENDDLPRSDIFTRSTLERLEVRIFEHLRYPKVTYRGFRILSDEESDRQFIESEIMALYDLFTGSQNHPFLEVMRHYERLYRLHHRLHQIKPIRNFYYEAIRWFFLYVYEARLKFDEYDPKSIFLKLCENYENGRKSSIRDAHENDRSDQA